MNKVVEANGLSIHEDEDSIDLKKIFNKLFDKWIWFVISILICLIFAFLYGKYTPPSYQINAKLLVNDNEKGGGLSNQTGALMDLGGLMTGKNSVDNEVEILRTRFLMEQVVRKLQLNIVYSVKLGWINRELYDAPFRINILNGIDTIKNTRLNISKLSSGKIKVTTTNFEKNVNFGEPFNILGIGQLRIDVQPGSKMNVGNNFYATVSSIDDRVLALMGQLKVDLSNKQASIIDLSLNYTVPKKGEDILNVLIDKYTAANLSDKNAIADSTYRFIKERLTVIASELGDVENKVESFKQKNQLADMSEQGKLLVQNTGEFSTELAKAETQVTVLNDLERYLKDNNSNKRVFPSSLLAQDAIFSNLMNQYNSLLIEREKQLLSVTENSPFIQNIDKQILELRSNILSNVQSTRESYILNRNKLRSQLNKAEGKISGVPLIEKNYLKLARNQQIKQELYIFLMQKAEETAISKTSNISVAKTIDPPKSNTRPDTPKKNLIYLAGFVFGLIIPIGLIFGKEMFVTSIKTKDDVTSLTQIPIVGEISHNLSSDNLVVANMSRSAISEQFRALRTNLSFYLRKDSEKVILLTSSMSGEGKSFTAINLGNIFALTGKKVLLMELDLRKPGLSAKLGVHNDIGFSNYTMSNNLQLSQLIKPLRVSKNMFIIASGPLPPNPAETLMNDQIPKLIDDLKKEFDYIIMDAPPIGIIADAQLLARYSDVVLYLVRQNVTQKTQISIAQELYKSGKMKNMGIVVNDIESKYYGYGYGYGTYGENETGKWYTNLFNRVKK